VPSDPTRVGDVVASQTATGIFIGECGWLRQAFAGETKDRFHFMRWHNEPLGNVSD
jgi:hypothetical protein